MTICLINPPTNYLQKFNSNFQHLGLAYIHSYLIKHGHTVDLYDLQAHNMSIKDVFEKMNRDYDMVGISMYSHNAKNAVALLARIKRQLPYAFIFVGGYSPTLMPEKLNFIFNYADCMVIGEGEQTVLSLANTLNGNWKHVSGIAYMENENLKINSEVQLIHDLDILPFPSRTLMDNVEYNVITSRGCYGNCSFCSIYSFYKRCEGKVYRRRSAENVVEEIKMLVQKYHAKTILFDDDLFMISSSKAAEWFDKFYCLIIQNNINVNFKCSLRANEIVNKKDVLVKFKEIGLECIFVGIESFLQKQLDFLNKHITVELNTEALKILDKLDIRYEIGYMVFTPITNIQDIIDTVNYFFYIHFNQRHKYPTSPISSNTVNVFPGTIIEKYVIDNNLQSDNDKGYVFQDTDTELCYKEITNWNMILQKKLDELTGKCWYNFINAGEEERKMYNQMFLLDLEYLRELAVNVKQHEIKYKEIREKFIIKLAQIKKIERT